ncbi:MAG TPA: hypothetical protein VGH80_00260 [Xanthomonadaceae bacterium]|jgi:hypothetical protein
MPRSHPAPKRHISPQERAATWVSCGTFFSSLVPLLIERVAFDNTLGELQLVCIGLGTALLLSIPCVAVIRRLDLSTGDRWAAGIFLVLGLCIWSVAATTWINHRFASGPHRTESLQVLEKKYVVPARSSNGPEYWLRLRYRDEDKWITVAFDDYDRASVGKPHEVDVVQGALGLPVIGCADCY